MNGCNCGRSWTGTRMAHCAACHETFSTTANFDRHRKGFVCAAPEDVDLVHDDRGVWKQPGGGNPWSTK